MKNWAKSASFLGMIFLLLIMSLMFNRLSQQTSLQMFTGSQPESTAQVVYLPNIASNQKEPAQSNSQQTLPTPTPDGVTLPPNWKDTDPTTLDPDKNKPFQLPTEPFSPTVPYVPIPTPEPNEIGIPEIDQISVINLRELAIPKSDDPTIDVSWFYGDTSWSSDSQKFIGYFANWINGSDNDELYLGNVATNEFSLWEKNGLHPSWSRDNSFITYLARQLDGNQHSVMKHLSENTSRPQYNLVRRSIDSSISKVLITDVEPPNQPLAQVLESWNGKILIQNKNQILMLPDTATLLRLSSTTDNLTAAGFTPTTLLDANQFSKIPNSVAYSLSPDGKFALILVPSQKARLVDITTQTVIDEIGGPIGAVNIAWSTNSQLVAFTNEQGLFVYDRTNRLVRQLVTNQDINLRSGDFTNGIVLPTWLQANNLIMFSAFSPDWSATTGPTRNGFYTFVVTADGNHRRVLGNFQVESVSPDKKHITIRKQDPLTGYFSLFLADING